MKNNDSKLLILVDKTDKELGFKEKKDCHLGKGIKHRAFIVFLFNKSGQLLLSKRSQSKLLWPGFWDTTFASHVLKGENYKDAAVRRAKEELGLKIGHKELRSIGGFSYQSEYENVGSENEYCQIFIDKLTKAIKPNEKEVSEVKFKNKREISRELSLPKEKFTPWFKIAFRMLLGTKVK